MLLAQPLWIIAGLITLLLLGYLLTLLQRQKAKQLELFAAKKLLPNLTRTVSKNKQRMKLFLFLAGIFACFIALARPQYGHRWVDVKRKGIDILFAIDTSASMLVEDIRPNRLERSKFAILDFVAQLEGDRVGILPFAGTSFLLCPLTVDYHAFEQSLDAVTADIVPQPGTSIGNAIRKAEAVLDNDTNHKLLIIITDGEDLEGDGLQAATEAAENGMTIFTVGVGTTTGELIPVKTKSSQGFVKDSSGQFVTSKLDEKTLREVAEITNGMYAPLGNKGQGLEDIYSQKLILIPKEELAEKRHKIPIERFQWPLSLALFLLSADFLLGGRKSGSGRFRLPTMHRRRTGSNGWFFLFLAFPALFPINGQASPGEDAFQQEDYLTASQYYQKALIDKPDDTTLLYNYGSSVYKNNLYDEAIASFTKALRTDDLNLQEKIYYNLGNAQYKKGEESIQGDPDKTIQLWEDALQSFNSSLALEPNNDMARNNHDLVKQRLEELRKQQQKQKEEQQEKQDQQDKGQQNNQNGGQQPEEKKQKQQDGQDPEQHPHGEKEQHNDKPQPEGNENNPENTMNGVEEGKQQDSSVPEELQNEQKEANHDRSSGKTGEMERTEDGQMSVEEAKQLLNEIRNEGGLLNFIPRQPKKPAATQGGDW